MKSSDYTFEEHIHRYAVWTAARASQRGFTSTTVIDGAIARARHLRDYLAAPKVDAEEFDMFHREAAKALMEELKCEAPVNKCTYGRAAKIIAIYLKTAVVLRLGPEAPESLVIHPPIDRILLNNFASKLKKHYPDSKHLAADLRKNWTELTQDEYWELVETIQKIGAPLNWRLEEYWEISGED